MQTTLAAPVTASGAGLHTGRRATVTLHPAPADHGVRVTAHAAEGEAPVPVRWDHWVPSRMSTSVSLGDGRAVRTVEHLMAALVAHGIDNVLISIAGDEMPIFDGSAARWCACLSRAGRARSDRPRRAIRVRKPVQVAHEGGFLRAEPGDGFAVDVTHDLLPGFPVMRWHGRVDAATFDRELARSRSFGNLFRRVGIERKPVPRPAGPARPNEPDLALVSVAAPWADIMRRKTACDPRAPLLRGWRPWRAALIADGWILPWPRFPDEPVRHVALDMIGDLALAGAPLIGRVVAHNPSHEKTYALVAALMRDPEAWALVEGDAGAPAPDRAGLSAGVGR